MIVLTTARVAFFIFGGMKVTGRENIPKSGPVILAPNHISHADPPAVACAANRDFLFMAKEELFRGLFGRLIFSVGSFPVKRGSNDTESIRKAITLLERGSALVVFPEGSRGDGVKMGTLNKGVALLAKKTGAKIVPVGINGTQKLLPKGSRKMKRAKTLVHFGEPFLFEDAGPQGGKVTSEMFTQYLAQKVLAAAKEVGLSLEGPTPGTLETDAVADL